MKKLLIVSEPLTDKSKTYLLSLLDVMMMEHGRVRVGFAEVVDPKVKPDLVLCLGAAAVQEHIDPRARIRDARTLTYKKDGLRYRATFLPSMVMKDSRLESYFYQDIEEVFNELSGTV